MSYVDTLFLLIKGAYNLWWRNYRDYKSFAMWYLWKKIVKLLLCDISNRDCQAILCDISKGTCKAILCDISELLETVINRWATVKWNGKYSPKLINQPHLRCF